LLFCLSQNIVQAALLQIALHLPVPIIIFVIVIIIIIIEICVQGTANDFSLFEAGSFSPLFDLAVLFFDNIEMFVFL
jgi:hypothetical protein